MGESTNSLDANGTIVEKSTYSKSSTCLTWFILLEFRPSLFNVRRTCQSVQGRTRLRTDTEQLSSIDVQVSHRSSTTTATFGSLKRMSGISPFTQTGFELAKAGLWKPRDHTLPPIVYGLKLLKFKPPFFDIGRCALSSKLMP